MTARAKLESRFWAMVDKGDPDACWHWKGTCDRKGYGNISRNNCGMRATHASLEIAGKPRPSTNHEACHSCDNPPCVNPAHLWWGTRADNMRDCSSKGRRPASNQTHCHRGHLLSDDNVYLTPTGWRECRSCAQKRKQDYRSRQRMEKSHAA